MKPAEIGEAASLAISVIILLALIGYLSYAALRQHSDQLAVSSTVGRVIAAGANSDQFVVPVAIHNDGTRSITSLHIDITVDTRHHTIELQYLPAGAHHTIYVYSPQAAQPRVTITPLSYRID